ncbi:MAG: HU family DNA-binding protein [Nitrospinota bacterium]|nr:HU family DNA-binding protein [Nitrospinota bacterium]HJM42413.1 HU family DNA-binding protein [Nitrospinota bacterium]
MNKGDLVKRMADGAGITLKEAESALKAALDGVKKSLSQNDKVTLVGFGTFSVSKRKARIGRNPRTGESLKIAARNIPKFAAGRELKDAVN